MKGNGRAVGFVVALEDVLVVIHIGNRHLVFFVDEVKKRGKEGESLYVERKVLPQDILPCDCEFYGMKHSAPILIPNDLVKKF